MMLAIINILSVYILATGESMNNIYQVNYIYNGTGLQIRAIPRAREWVEFEVASYGNKYNIAFNFVYILYIY